MEEVPDELDSGDLDLLFRLVAEARKNKDRHKKKKILDNLLEVCYILMQCEWFALYQQSLD
jgi:hypothetical protein